MTENNVKCFERPVQSASTSARLSEKIRRRPSGQVLPACWTTYKMERASRTTMFSSRKKLPYAANLHSKGSRSCDDTSGKSARLSLQASDTSSSSEHEHSRTTSGAVERSARDLARTVLELLLNLVRSEPRPTSANSRHPSRTANANPFSDASVEMQTSSRENSNHCGEDTSKCPLFCAHR